MNLPGSGLWVDEPWRVQAFGAVHWITMGAAGLQLFWLDPGGSGATRRLRQPPDAAVERRRYQNAPWNRPGM